jgi:hypothetical protein
MKKDYEFFAHSFRKEISPTKGMYLTMGMMDFFGAESMVNEEVYPYYSIQQVGLYRIFGSMEKGKPKERVIRTFLVWQAKEEIDIPLIYVRDLKLFGSNYDNGLEFKFHYTHDNDFSWNECSLFYDKMKEWKKGRYFTREIGDAFTPENDPVQEGLNKAWILSNGEIGERMDRFGMG